MPYTAAVCDDNAADAQRIAACVNAWSAAAGCAVQVSCYPSAEAFLFACEETGPADILLLDVEMKGMTGIGLAKQLRAKGCRAEIIFITSHFEFSGEGYEVDALHYLVKPVAEQKLCAVLDKAAEKLRVQPASVVISCEGETVRLYQTDILYAESFLHYIAIHTKTAVYKVKESISAFEERLGEGFFRIHRSYIVSLDAVTRITRTGVELCDNTKLPVSRTRYDALNRAFIAHR